MARQRITHAMLERQLETLAERLGVPYVKDYSQSHGLTINGESMGAVSISWKLKSGGIKRLGNGVVSTREAYEQISFANDVLHWTKNVDAYDYNPRTLANPAQGRTSRVQVKNPRPAGRQIPLAKMKKILAPLGMVVTLRDGEYRYNFKGGTEATAGYTDDSLDAINSATDMAKRRDAGKNPPRKNPPKFKPPYSVQVNSERDNLDIWLSDRDDKNIAHWHDDDARQMIEDGFFSDKGGKKLADSVVEYARDMGMIS